MNKFQLPNVRKMFIPDEGMIMCDADLSGADAQVFAKETGDEALLRDFRDKIDIHSQNAEFMWGSGFTSLPKEGYERYHKRQQCKHSVHATHNVGSPMALVRHPSIAFTKDEAIRFQSHWFQIHPAIKPYFERVDRQLMTTRSVSNRFGYRIIYFDRIDVLLPQAIPWINQSTVAECTFRGALQVQKAFPWVEMLIQVHDSVVFQFPSSKFEPSFVDQLKKTLEVPVPYADPLVIPWKCAFSNRSWGDCSEDFVL